MGVGNRGQKEQINRFLQSSIKELKRGREERKKRK